MICLPCRPSQSRGLNPQSGLELLTFASIAFRRSALTQLGKSMYATMKKVKGGALSGILVVSGSDFVVGSIGISINVGDWLVSVDS